VHVSPRPSLTAKPGCLKEVSCQAASPSGWPEDLLQVPMHVLQTSVAGRKSS